MSSLEGGFGHKRRRYDLRVANRLMEPQRFTELTVLLVGDDTPFIEFACELFQAKGVPTRVFETGESLLAGLSDPQGLLITELRLQDMHGLELLEAIRETNACLPAILIGSELPVASVVLALRRGAINALEKPCNGDQLWNASMEGLKIAYLVRDEHEELLRIDEVLANLDEDETRLLDLTLNGSTSRESGEQLGFAVRTIERQRSRIYGKLGVNSVIGVMHMQQRKATLEARIRSAFSIHPR